MRNILLALCLAGCGVDAAQQISPDASSPDVVGVCTQPAVGHSCVQGSDPTTPTPCACGRGWCVVDQVGASPVCRLNCAYGCALDERSIPIVGGVCYCDAWGLTQ